MEGEMWIDSYLEVWIDCLVCCWGVEEKEWWGGVNYFGKIWKGIQREQMADDAWVSSYAVLYEDEWEVTSNSHNAYFQWDILYRGSCGAIIMKHYDTLLTELIPLLHFKHVLSLTPHMTTFLPHLVKMQYLHFRFHTNYFFFNLERFLKKLADGRCSSITKGSICHVKHVYIQPFTTVVDWPEIACLMEVSTMFYICRYCVFTWWGRFIKHPIWNNTLWNYTVSSCIFSR